MSNNTDKKPGSSRKWGYASYYDDPKTNETKLIYTSIEKNGSVNRYEDIDGKKHTHIHWDDKKNK